MSRRKFFTKKRKKQIYNYLVLIVVLIVGYFSKDTIIDTLEGEVAPVSSTIVKSENDLVVHYIDVGQGDASLIQTANANVLIDGGDLGTKDELLAYLQKNGVKKLDLIVATHPHNDHIGGLKTVIDALPVSEILMPEAVHTTKTFEYLLETIEKKKVKVTKSVAGAKFTIDKMDFQIVAPNGSDYKDLNDFSVCLKMTFGENSFLFMGDAEKLSEKEILAAGFDVSADVLKVGHHASSSSTDAKFLAKVAPQIAVISCAKDNDYGFPHKQTLDTLAKQKVQVLRTDELGTIILRSNGKEITMEK